MSPFTLVALVIVAVLVKDVEMIPGQRVKRFFHPTWKPSEYSGTCGLKSSGFSIAGGRRKRVAGGEGAHLGQFPFMALLGFSNQIKNKIEYTCSGSLINRYYVLTAASCVTQNLGEPKEIVLDELVISTEEDCSYKNTHCTKKQTFTPAEIHVHEGYVHESYDGDNIALIRLDRPADFLFDAPNAEKGFVSPICIPWNNEILGYKLESIHVTLAGWGHKSGNPNENFQAVDKLGAGVDHLQFLEFPDGVMSFKECQDHFETISVDLDSTKQLCTKPPEKGKTGCNGDSGGPLFMRAGGEETPWYQIGIISFGQLRCARSNDPTVYTRVSAYVDWISSKMEVGEDDTRGR